MGRTVSQWENRFGCDYTSNDEKEGKEDEENGQWHNDSGVSLLWGCEGGKGNVGLRNGHTGRSSLNFMLSHMSKDLIWCDTGYVSMTQRNT